MACFRTSLRSQTMVMDTLVNIILPYDYYDANGNPGRCDKVLYLLHGLKQNADAWTRFSGVERFANYYGYAVVMPEVQRSFYTNMAYGPRYFDYVAQELPRVMQAMFRLPNDPKKTFVGGLSMGGYGALKCALHHPEQFAGAMCFSSGFFVLDKVGSAVASKYYVSDEMRGIVGADLTLPAADDLTARIEHFPREQQKPLVYLACGTEDFLYNANTRMRDLLLENQFDVRYEEWPGEHSWRFWDVALEKGMVYMDERVK